MSEPVRNHLKEMLDAFNMATGMSLGLSPFRKRCLLALRAIMIDPKLDASDVASVMDELKRRVRVMPQSYDHRCLEFENAIAKTDRFEERAVKLRKLKAAKAAKEAKPQAAQPARQETSEAEAERIRAKAKEIARDLKAKLSGRPQP